MSASVLKTTRGWILALGVAVGVAAGLGGYTLYYAKAFSYLGNDAQACANLENSPLLAGVA